MSAFDAYIGGIHAFFSVWIFCLMQVIPFFAAFMLGAAYTGRESGNFARVWKQALLTALVSLAGFTIVFSSMGMTTSYISKLFFNNLGLANQFGGVALGLIGCYFIGWLTLGGLEGAAAAATRYGFAFVFGGAMGFAYKPCVTPTLTKIFSLTSVEQTASTGGMMLVLYSLGISTALLAMGMALAWIGTELSSATARSAAQKACGAVLLIGAILILSDSMPAYKRFLVGRFVPQVSHSHDMGGGMEHGH